MSQERKHASPAHRQAAYRARCEQARQTQLREKGLPALPSIASIPGWPRWNASLKSAHELIANTVDEMQDYYDDRSEEWQESERGVEHVDRLNDIEELRDTLANLS